MRIGIVPTPNPHSGGVYQYSATMLEALRQHTEGNCADEFVVFSGGVLPGVVSSQPNRAWSISSQPLEDPPSWRQRSVTAIRSVLGEGAHREAVRSLMKVFRKSEAQIDLDKRNPRQNLTERFRREGVGLMLYPFPVSIAFETEVPYVMSVHDLQHRLQPEFPEVSAFGEWDRREYLFRNGTRYATLLVADSEVGKEDILNFYERYGVTPDQVKVLPFLPACSRSAVAAEERARVRKVHRLPERYLFYPAQFWPHKNHKRIIQALALLKERGMNIDIVFCGSNHGVIRRHTYREAMALVSRLGISGNVHYRGYVTDEDIAALYAEAAGLVMPTFFGPTNIPVLEAWAFECPVLTSDIRGIREQVQDAAVLVDPRSIECIAEGIARLWNDDTLRHNLVQRGSERLGEYTPADYQNRLIDILEEGKMRREGVKMARSC